MIWFITKILHLIMIMVLLFAIALLIIPIVGIAVGIIGALFK
jgi:hypothetical protein